MSDDWMIVIPADPLALPSREQADAVMELLSVLQPAAQSREFQISDLPCFIDCGGNYEGVFCPFCGAEIGEWWVGAMDRWWEGNRRILSVETPCCGRPASLDALDYVMPQGLACAAFEVMNPGRALTSEEVEQIESRLGLPVRLIWCHI